MAALSDRLTAGAPTAYDAVKRVEGYLLDNYAYSEDPPERSLPLESFLFADRIGYCQQFSGAMTLMLRMQGIPARVAAGFSPGQPTGSGRYRVRDLDAHSWVEVYFAGIGWVPFDPTPAASPAELRTGGAAATSSAASSLDPLLHGAQAFGGVAAPTDPAAAARSGPLGPTAGPASGPGEDGTGPLPAVMLGLAALAGVLFLVPPLRRRIGERRRGAAAAVDTRVAELERALARLGFGQERGATLLELESSLRSRSEPLAVSYVQRLRRARYGRDPAQSPPPGRERRALRRRLSAGGGLAARLAAYRAIPPLSPRS